MKNKLIGLTEYAKQHLIVEDLETLEEMIGCEVEKIEGEKMVYMPDGVKTHIDFLILEPSLTTPPNKGQ